MERFRKIFYIFFSAISLILLILSLSLHIWSFFTLTIRDTFPSYQLLFIGFPLLLIAYFLFNAIYNKIQNNKLISLDEEIKTAKPDIIKKHTNSNSGKVFIILCLILGIYNLVSFGVSFNKPKAEFEQGIYFLKEKSKVIKQISKDEYNQTSTEHFRSFSAFLIFMYFYLLGVGLLYEQMENEEEL